MATEPMTSKSTNGSSFFFKDALPGPARIYIALTILAGIPVLVFSIYHSIMHQDWNWFYLATLTAVASLLAVRIPIVGTRAQSITIGVSDVFAFVALLLFCPQVATAVAGVEVLVTCLRTPVKRLYKLLFNFAQLPLVTYVVGLLLEWIKGPGDPLVADQSGSFATLLALVLAGGAAYFLLNTGAVALAVALSSRLQFFEVWRRNFASLCVANLVNEATAAIIFAFLRPVNLVIIATIVPLALVIYYMRKINVYRTQQAGNARMG